MSPIIERWIMLNNIEKTAKKEKESIRSELLRIIEEDGVNLEDSSKRVSSHNGTIIRKERKSNIPDTNKLIEILKANGLEIEEAFDVKSELVVNPSKINNLIERGIIKAAEIESNKKVSYIIRVINSKNIKMDNSIIDDFIRD